MLRIPATHSEAPRFRIPAGVWNIFLRHCVHTGSEAHPATYQMDARGKSAGA